MGDSSRALDHNQDGISDGFIYLKLATIFQILDARSGPSQYGSLNIHNKRHRGLGPINFLNDEITFSKSEHVPKKKCLDRLPPVGLI